MGLRVFATNENNQWNNIVKSFHDWDIYYLYEYAVSFQLHGDGTPLLIYYENNGDRFCYVVMMRDIAEDAKFAGTIEKGRYFDFESPYGYGGPLSDQKVSEDSQRAFLHDICQYAKDRGVVSQFVRFHPLLNNYETINAVFETRYLHQTIYIDTSSPEIIMSNMDSKNRNMVRKAIKNGVSIERREIDSYQDFVPIYKETMNKDEADDYYYFSKDYFEEQLKLKEYASFFYAVKDGKPVAGAIMYYNDRYMHYHLAGTITEYRKYSPSNLLLYEAGCWASKVGIKQFHLGGGMVEDDNLFGFKKQFNKNGRLSFYIGRTIFDNETYSYLLNKRKELDSNFNVDNNRMIQYRA